jgi:xanthine/CO dehydrogenase XdhC/CoxF family maturation factor
MTSPLDAPLGTLVRDYRELRARGAALVLASIVDTAGSTYQKAGARMLIAADGEIRGLLSGGCLENDLRELARDVAAAGNSQLVSYDMRSPDDMVFGMGAGCEGAMRILLQRVGPAEDWQPLEAMACCHDAGRREALATVIESADPDRPAGTCFWEGATTTGVPEPAAVAALRRRALGAGRPLLETLEPPTGVLQCLAAPIESPPALLLLGAGPDARPLARLAVELGLRVTVVDHRPAYAEPRYFPGCDVRCIDADSVAQSVAIGGYAAAVVMSHYLPADEAYLRALARGGPRYVGLLGPSARRERLLASLGHDAAGLRGRLRGPVGLDIGARTPQAIAISIVAEIHAFLAGRHGEPFSETAAP